MTWEKLYCQKFEEWVNNQISDEEWENLCTYILTQLMYESMDVLIRLKEGE